MMENHLLPGTILQNGRYRIGKVLGQGGFGITYLAEQIGLNRTVAIKEFFIDGRFVRCPQTSRVSVPSIGGEKLILTYKQKFVKEAQTIAGMNHPNIVHIFDVFEENGTAYYVMEYLGAGILSDKIAGRGLPYKEAISYIRQLCDALAYVHAQNILHLDVKPSNVLFRKPGEVVLIDFGVSRHYSEFQGGQRGASHFGVSRGYAPLEQNNAGGPLQLSPATDIYSLGATFYAMLTGKNPPDAADLVKFGLPPFPVSVPSSFIVLIQKAMHPDVKGRPQGIKEFLVMLDVAEEKAALPQTFLGQKPQPPVKTKEKKSNALWWVLLSVVLVVVWGFLIWMFYAGKEKKQPVRISSNVQNGHSWVDMGLPSGIKWASCNIGADRPYDSGSYFSWGETLTKSRYDSYNGTYHDVAQVIWGEDWMVPTEEDFVELMEECTWTWDMLNGRAGYKVTSKSNGSSIFFPASGLYDGNELVDPGFSGNYWSSTSNDDKTDRAYSLQLAQGECTISRNSHKYIGMPVRPVMNKNRLRNLSEIPISVLEDVAVAEEVEEIILTSTEDIPPYEEIPAEHDEIIDDEDFEINIIDYYEEEVVEEEVEEEAIPFQLVEVKPSFLGGDANSFSKWVNERLVYPDLAKENGVQGRVTLQFTVDRDGSVINVIVLRGADPLLDQEAVRVVSMSPKWVPGKQRERTVPVTYTFPVIFKLT